MSVKNSGQLSGDERNSTQLRRLCGNWNDKLKLLRFIGEEITLTLVSNTKNIIRDFEARVRRIDPNSNANKPKNNSDHNLSSFSKDSQNASPQCSTTGKFIFHSNWCFMLDYYPQVSYRTGLQVCAEHNSNLLTVANQMTDFYSQIDLIRMLLSLQPNGQQINHGDFWVQSPDEERTVAKSNEESSSIDVQQLNTVKAKRAESSSDWFLKINDNSLSELKSTDCLMLVLDEYHYLTENHLKMKSPSLENTRNASMMIVQLLDTGLIRRVPCDQRAAFVCQRRPCDATNATSRTADCSYPAKPAELHQVFTQPNELSLTSSNFPNNYPNLLHQSVLVNVTDPKSVYIIQFLYLDIETQTECLYDYLSLDFYDDSNQAVRQNSLRICGRVNSDQHRSHHVHPFNSHHPHRHNHQLYIAQTNHLTNFSYVTKPGEFFYLISCVPHQEHHNKNNLPLY